MGFISKCDRSLRAVGALQGLAIGDALGAPFEGQKKSVSASVLFCAGELHITDDTHQACAIAESLIKNRAFVESDIVYRLMQEYEQNPYVYGPTSSAFFQMLAAGESPRRAAHRVVQLGGGTSNGSVMRSAPIGIMYPPDGGRAIALRCSALTHPTTKACECAAFYTTMISSLVRGGKKQEAYSLALSRCRDPEIGRTLSSLYESPLEPTLDSLSTTHIAVSLFLESTGPEEGVNNAIALGGDTDTNAALVGSLWGAAGCIDHFPRVWRDAVKDLPHVAETAYQLARIAL